jgi:hypothetical protein
MKTILIVILTIVLSGLIISQIYAMNSRKDIESYPYQVIKKYKDFETRVYEASLFNSVKLPYSNYKESSRKGFSLLASYIFGSNESNEKIAMTSPVMMSLGDSMTMHFLVPKQYSKETLPKPNNNQVELTQFPEKKVAVISFKGWADDEKIEKYKQELIKHLKEENIDYKGPFYFLGYNPPFELFNRKNEVMVEIVD